jgi:methylenetetrahydrofolate reductase (NADPH)
VSFFRTTHSGPSLSFEFFPPREESLLPAVKAQISDLAAVNPDFVTITYGAAGGARALSKEIVRWVTQETQLKICPHLTCAGHTREELFAVIDEYIALGINALLALRGDPLKGQSAFEPVAGGYSCARDFVRDISGDKSLAIAVAGYPETHKEAKSREADLKYLREKVDAGAEVIITQLFFDEAVYFRFVEEAQDYGITVPILPGILPISNLPQLERMTKMCGATIPKRLVSKLQDHESNPDDLLQLGIDEGVRLCKELLRGGAPGIHLYTLNKTNQVGPIVAALGLGEKR